EYHLFKRYRSTVRRQRMLRKWLRESLALLGGSALVLLGLSFAHVAPLLAAVERWPWMVWLRDQVTSGGSFVRGALIGAAIGVVVLVVWAVFWARTKNDDEGDGPAQIDTLGDIAALLPRNRAELKYGWGLSINAGVVEELLFRLALPALLFAVWPNAVFAVVVSLVLFAGMHAYQGLGGVLGTLVFGALMMAVFLLTGSILWPIILHALFDLRSLVLIPMVVQKVHRVV
ncbi:MAG TPA: CPBP family intramembrane metalloprotease, partial [Terrimesophilobacter sp.]|nr:CPBP family intramembrane metalloprotease [Terrimesophilobacter sp.]